MLITLPLTQHKKSLNYDCKTRKQAQAEHDVSADIKKVHDVNVLNHHCAASLSVLEKNFWVEFTLQGHFVLHYMQKILSVMKHAGVKALVNIESDSDSTEPVCELSCIWRLVNKIRPAGHACYLAALVWKAENNIWALQSCSNLIEISPNLIIPNPYFIFLLFCLLECDVVTWKPIKNISFANSLRPDSPGLPSAQLNSANRLTSPHAHCNFIIYRHRHASAARSKQLPPCCSHGPSFVFHPEPQVTQLHETGPLFSFL